MKSDARYLINQKKWKKNPGNNKTDIWKSRGSIDARKILNIKRSKQMKPPVLGSFMRTKSATALIAEQIKKEITAQTRQTKVPNKQVQLSRDGNIIVTSKSSSSQGFGRRHVTPKLSVGVLSNRPVEDDMDCLPSAHMDDLEHTSIEDVLDLESLPPAYVAPKSLSSANLAGKSVLHQVLSKKHTMVADQLSEYNNMIHSKIYVSNLHPSVSRNDVMELFSDIGVIKSIQMVKPGTATIEFFHEEDAVKACEIYHNRLLDGLPMKCFLQSASSPQKFAISQRLGNRSQSDFASRNTSLSPTIFNPRSRYNPRNVQFTVKLP